MSFINICLNIVLGCVAVVSVIATAFAVLWFAGFIVNALEGTK